MITLKLQNDKKLPSESRNKFIAKEANQKKDIEIDVDLHMAPIKEYPIKVKVIQTEKARPKIDPRDFEVLEDLEEENL